jgi:hypothetical protein
MCVCLCVCVCVYISHSFGYWKFKVCASKIAPRMLQPLYGRNIVPRVAEEDREPTPIRPFIVALIHS